MYLQKLEISGFKSFAKKTVLEFSKGITAVVGPNGTGKSNITDAIRWVLAEQSFKNLRGKKSEDLIFHGSSSARPLSQAKVSLFFDSEGDTPIDLEEVVISRQVARDGQNSYILNGRQVRLMDLDSFLAKSGIGASSFRVLSQGMSDMLVSLGPLELKEFVEDAAGVKEYQDKKHRSLLKIKSTEKNIEKVSVLMAELKPRLRFLKREKGKFDRRDEVEERLKREVKKLFSFRHNRLINREKKILESKKKTEKELNFFEKSLKDIKKELFSFDKKNNATQKLKNITKKIRGAEEEENNTSKKIIEIQGQISLLEERMKQTIPVTKEYLISGLEDIVKTSSGHQKEKISEVLSRVVDKARNLLEELNKGRKKDSRKFKEEIKNLQRKLKEEKEKREGIRTTIDELKKEREKEEGILSKDREEVTEKEFLWRQESEKAQELRLKLNEISLEEEKILVRREQLNHDLKSLGVLSLADVIGEKIKDIDEKSSEEEIWKLKNKLDEIGKIDPEVQEEFSGVKERYDFLKKESEDLTKTLNLLQKLVRDLDKEIEKLFKEALKKMSNSFGSYFRLMFGGGKASLVHKNYNKKEITDDDSNLEREEVDEDYGGIEIKVDLPGKKIKGLDMLSGGERSLVSIALLFALVIVRKPPFLVLDEIDAALDEKNSQRFIRLLRELSKDTQFIIISHNRETMRRADALYGISMKDGVSYLLSIKLEGPEVDQQALN